MNKKKRLLIFGTGKKYKELRSMISNHDIVAFLDNDLKKEKTVFYGKTVYNPYRIPENIQYDAVLIMSIFYCEMKTQLINMGIDECKIYSLFQIGELQTETVSDQELQLIERWNKSKKRFLLIQHSGGGGGAVIALTSLALALSMKYSVLVTFPTRGETISVYEKYNLPYICNVQMNCDTNIFTNIISNADYILVNSIINNNVIDLLHRKGKMFYLWLHDHSTTYERSDCKLLKRCIDKNVKLLAVSRRAAGTFFSYVYKMPYILFPLAVQNCSNCYHNKKIVKIPTIAVVGNIYSVKGQDILLDALDKINNKYKLKLIGGVGTETEYAAQIIARCKEKKLYEYTGRKTNKEIHELYLKGGINILICPSRFETMSISTIEAMSYGVPVIVSDMTGIADYLSEMKEECIFETENCNDLAEKIEHILSNPERIRTIGTKMQMIYEKNFRIENLRERCDIFK